MTQTMTTTQILARIKELEALSPALVGADDGGYGHS